MREAESTLRFVGDLERACSAAVNAPGGAGGDYYRSKSFDKDVFFQLTSRAFMSL